MNDGKGCTADLNSGNDDGQMNDGEDSEERMIYIATLCTPQPSKAPSPRKRKKGQYLRKESGTSSQKEKKEANRIKGIHHRKRNAIYKELLHLKMDTQWERINYSDLSTNQ
ncbi:Hypothetical predicted protein [Mytilus galloprovincialis]|uniref:Uncharacterized protein n=1 Tax=Mytilus galloprovincialis TaxID=29158 RepID=A0A8B6FCV6_MYTGA|nr:Hypothetical predicted protein [Mytilus galloprovincialis]